MNGRMTIGESRGGGASNESTIPLPLYPLPPAVSVGVKSGSIRQSRYLDGQPMTMGTVTFVMPQTRYKSCPKPGSGLRSKYGKGGPSVAVATWVCQCRAPFMVLFLDAPLRETRPSSPFPGGKADF